MSGTALDRVAPWALSDAERGRIARDQRALEQLIKRLGRDARKTERQQDADDRATRRLERESKRRIRAAERLSEQLARLHRRTAERPISTAPTLAATARAVIHRSAPGPSRTAQIVSAAGTTSFHFALTSVSKSPSGFSSATAHVRYVSRPGAVATSASLAAGDEAARLMGYASRDEAVAVGTPSVGTNDREPDDRANGALMFGNIGRTRDEQEAIWKQIEEIEQTPARTRFMPVNAGCTEATLERMVEAIRTKIGFKCAIEIDARADAMTIVPPVTADDKVLGEISAVVNAIEPMRLMRGKGGRVQYRLIMGLPHELPPDRMIAACDEFTQTFRDRGLPYFGAIHQPSGQNNPLNWHVHLAFHDRPAKWIDTEHGPMWDFAYTTEAKTSSRHRTTIAPYRRNKDKWVDARSTPFELRSLWADIANRHLAEIGATKRWSPHTYAEMGIEVEPLKRLDQKTYALEMQGIPTRAGRERIDQEWSQRPTRARAIKAGRFAVGDSPQDADDAVRAHGALAFHAQEPETRLLARRGALIREIETRRKLLGSNGTVRNRAKMTLRLERDLENLKIVNAMLAELSGGAKPNGRPSTGPLKGRPIQIEIAQTSGLMRRWNTHQHVTDVDLHEVTHRNRAWVESRNPAGNPLTDAIAAEIADGVREEMLRANRPETLADVRKRHAASELIINQKDLKTRMRAIQSGLRQSTIPVSAAAVRLAPHRTPRTAPGVMPSPTNAWAVDQQNKVEQEIADVAATTGMSRNLLQNRIVRQAALQRHHKVQARLAQLADQRAQERMDRVLNELAASPPISQNIDSRAQRELESLTPVASSPAVVTTPSSPSNPTTPTMASVAAVPIAPSMQSYGTTASIAVTTSVPAEASPTTKPDPRPRMLSMAEENAQREARYAAEDARRAKVIEQSRLKQEAEQALFLAQHRERMRARAAMQAAAEAARPDPSTLIANARPLETTVYTDWFDNLKAAATRPAGTAKIDAPFVAGVDKMVRDRGVIDKPMTDVNWTALTTEQQNAYMAAAIAERGRRDDDNAGELNRVMITQAIDDHAKPVTVGGKTMVEVPTELAYMLSDPIHAGVLVPYIVEPNGYSASNPFGGGKKESYAKPFGTAGTVRMPLEVFQKRRADLRDTTIFTTAAQHGGPLTAEAINRYNAFLGGRDQDRVAEMPAAAPPALRNLLPGSEAVINARRARDGREVGEIDETPNKTRQIQVMEGLPSRGRPIPATMTPENMLDLMRERLTKSIMPGHRQPIMSDNQYARDIAGNPDTTRLMTPLTRLEQIARTNNEAQAAQRAEQTNQRPKPRIQIRKPQILSR